MFSLFLLLSLEPTHKMVLLFTITKATEGSETNSQSAEDALFAQLDAIAGTSPSAPSVQDVLAARLKQEGLLPEIPEWVSIEDIFIPFLNTL